MSSNNPLLSKLGLVKVFFNTATEKYTRIEITFFNFIIFISMCVNSMCVEVSMEARRGHRLPWNWGSSSCELFRVGAEN